MSRWCQKGYTPMNELALYMAVFIASAAPMLEVWLAVPAGMAAGLPLVPTALVAIVGNFSTVSIVVLAGENIRRWARKRWRKANSPENPAEAPRAKAGRMRGIAEKFGVPGLALLAPFVVGSHFGAIGAVATGARKSNILLWFLVALVLQAFIMGGLAAWGITSFKEEPVLPELW